MGEDVREVTIRPASTADAALLAELAPRLFRQTYEHQVSAADLDAFVDDGLDPRRMQAELADPDVRTLLVERDGRAIGYAQVRRRPLSTEAPAPHAEVELARLYLDRAWHGRGVAEVLLARVNELALDLGARFVWLGVWERNGRAVAFYEKHGFKTVGMQEFRLGSQSHQDKIMVAAVTAGAELDPLRPA
jgi:ribosomal protein S18 acetylase RimI-like enzyme